MNVIGLLVGAAAHANEGLLPAVSLDPAREAAIRALLPRVPELGWTMHAVRQAAGEDAALLFPGGPPELIETHSALADRMLIEAGPALAETRISGRVRALVLLRLQQAEAERDAIRRALSVLSLPGNRVTALRCLARTADAIWIAAGDLSTDPDRHSKRVILAGIYSATLLHWLRHGDHARAAGFLDRRLSGIAWLGRLRARLGGARRTA